ncbi:MAG: phospholipase D-like domain-containing protein [Kofleriaceae bacterium]
MTRVAGSSVPAPDPIPEPIKDEPSRAILVSLPRELAPYARTQLRWRPGCEVTVLRDGAEAFPAMLDAIASAKKIISFETYIFAADTTGERFKAALIERARAGVEVRLIYDAVGSFGLPDAFVNEMRAEKIEVMDFNPIAPWRRRFRLSHRDHRKILVVDNVVGFTGGLNIGDDYAPVSEGGDGWHDIHCRVTGPIVLDLARMFRRTWIRAGGTPFTPIPAAHTAPPGGGSSYVRLLDNTRRRQRGVVRRAYLHVIRAAKISILIKNAYFLPDLVLRRALARAARRGVDVRVIVPGRSDVRIIEWASLYVLRRLAKMGVGILRWRGPMMHAKTATIDATWSTIGTYNFDAMSRFQNLELTLEVLDPRTAHTLARTFEQDVANCDSFDEGVWQRLPWYTKMLAWIWFRLRRFL